jgi:aspartate/methionine/tyrosine aminotransferase
LSREVQLVSFHTVSKGFWGECGQRGGYFEMTNIPPKVIFPLQICYMQMTGKLMFFLYLLPFNCLAFIYGYVAECGLA